jgi:nicotinamidase-related amidase
MARHPVGNPDLHGAAPDQSHTALLVLDMISDFQFEDGSRLLRSALAVAGRIAALRKRAQTAGIPTIYVNDNFGRWRSDFQGLVRHCARTGSLGAPIVQLLRPRPDDYCILKPKHSGFFATALDTVLQYIGVERLILTGASSHQCVLFTANDAYVRDMQLLIPRDCICAPGAADTRLALQYFKRVLKADTRSSAHLRLPRRTAASA